MAASCTYVNDKGNPSKLYADALAVTGSAERADGYFWAVQTEQFKEDYPILKYTDGEPDFKEVINEGYRLPTDTVFPAINTKLEEVRKDLESVIELNLPIVFSNNGKPAMTDSGLELDLNYVAGNALFESDLKLFLAAELTGYGLIDVMWNQLPGKIKSQINDLRLKFPGMKDEAFKISILTNEIEKDENLNGTIRQALNDLKANLAKKVKTDKVIIDNYFATVDTATENGKMIDYMGGVAVPHTVFKKLFNIIESIERRIHKTMDVLYGGKTAEEADNEVLYHRLLKLKNSLTEDDSTFLEETLVAERDAALFEYLQLANSQIEEMNKKISTILHPTLKDKISGASEITGKKLYDFTQFLSTFQDLKDLVLFMKDSENRKASVFLSEGDAQRLIEDTEASYRDVMRKIKKISIMYVTDSLLKQGNTKFENAIREELERKYNLQFANLRKENPEKFKSDKKNWIDRHLKVSHTYQEIGARMMMTLEQSPQDISWLEMMFMDGDAINDEVIQMVAERLDKVDFTVMQTVNETYRELQKEYQDVSKILKDFSPQKKWEQFYTTFEYGKTTGEEGDIKTEIVTDVYLVDEYLPEFFHLAKELGEEFLKDNTKTIGVPYTNKKGQTKWRKKVLPSDKWKNPQWEVIQKNPALKKFYDFYKKQLLKDDKGLPTWGKLRKSIRLNRDVYYITKLPGMTKNNLFEEVADSGVLGVAKSRWQNVKDFFGNNLRDSEDYGGDVPADMLDGSALYAEIRDSFVRTDLSGKQLEEVPIRFRRRVPINIRSFDLPSMLVENHAMAENFRKKQEIKFDLELIRELLRERKVAETRETFLAGSSPVFTGEDINAKKIPLLKEGADSRALKAFESMLRHRLYGIASESSFKANEISKMLASYTGQVSLTLNYLSAGTNLFAGYSVNMIEAFGGMYFNANDLKVASYHYTKDFPHILMDLGKLAPASMTNLLIQKFNALSSWEAVTKRFFADTGMTQLYDNFSGTFMQSSGEHFIQANAMYAILHSFKIKGKNGKYLNASFKEVEDVKDAASLLDAYERIEKDGIVRLQLDDSVYSATNGHLEFTGLTEIQKLDEIEKIKQINAAIDRRFEETGEWGRTIPIPNFDTIANTIEFGLSRFITELNIQMQGNYDNRKMPLIRRSWYGRLLLVLRRWMPRTVVRRFRGINTIKLSPEQIRFEDKYYNRALGNFEEGIYTSGLRYGLMLGRELLRIKWRLLQAEGRKEYRSIRKTEWNKLTDAERAGCYRTVIDIGYSMSLLLISKGLYELAKKIDDDDDKSKQFAFYLVFFGIKTQRELTFYYNPMEALTVLNSPSVTLKLINKLLLLVGQFSDPFEEYKTGKRKGDSKLVKKLFDVIPGVKQPFRDIEEQVSYYFNVRGQQF